MFPPLMSQTNRVKRQALAGAKKKKRKIIIIPAITPKEKARPSDKVNICMNTGIIASIKAIHQTSLGAPASNLPDNESRRKILSECASCPVASEVPITA